MKITVLGVVLFVVFVGAFFAWFGEPPRIPRDSFFSPWRVRRAWISCALLFVTGAATACFGDKEYGLFPPTSLRWLFIVLGALVMIASTAWMHTLTKAWRDEKSVLLHPPSMSPSRRG